MYSDCTAVKFQARTENILRKQFTVYSLGPDNKSLQLLYTLYLFCFSFNDVGETAFSTVVALLLSLSSVERHEDSSTTDILWTFASQANNLVSFNFVESQSSHFDFFVFVCVLLWGFVVTFSFLTFLTTTAKTEDEVKGGFLLDVVILEGDSFWML
eukprot:TRINITY_DN304_c0_g1_i13.p1 TRINITY_DN304_c0_g1~~TRINITY_DN304_c0_g1_i13.p1  ORF type:complete len:156 (+),score=5.09 TRINITY_DN304_c0_g1_i13:85-552(+)